MPRVSIGLGLGIFPFGSVKAFWQWVDLCEAGGVDSLWQSDRIVSSEPLLESMSVMAALAGRTRRLKFGMNVVSLAFRDPVLLAKQCATIDVLSEGRILPAFGIGSPVGPEWKAMDIDPKTRGARADEALEIMTRLWTGDNVSYEGRHYRISNVTISPKPSQEEIPVWIGGSSEGAIRRTARFGTGWQSAGETPQEIGPVIQAIRKATAELGREIDEGHYGAGFPFFFGRDDDPIIEPVLARYKRIRQGKDPRELFVIGDADAIFERVADYVRQGASKFILIPAVSGDEQLLKQTRMLIEQVLPRIDSLSS